MKQSGNDGYNTESGAKAPARKTEYAREEVHESRKDSGCSGTWIGSNAARRLARCWISSRNGEPQEDAAISTSEDGVITEYVQETLDESYCSASELEKMITSDVADYNSKHGENTIQVKSYEASDDGKVHLVMEYATANDYAVFNNVEF